MALFAKLIYRALVWKERQRARRARNFQRAAAKGPLNPTAESEAVARPESPVSGGADSGEGGRAAHLETGKRGESLAYWYLRQAGYTIVARNHASRFGAGELDLVAWDGPVLVFIEVKTRSSLDAGHPEAAVSSKKQTRVAKTAREYMRRLTEKRKAVQFRFDTVSVLWDSEAGYHVRLTKDAFKAPRAGQRR